MLQIGLEVIGCGSYRRGKKTCGDLDVLVTHEDEDALDELFERILGKLRKTGFLTNDLTVQKDGNQQVTTFTRTEIGTVFIHCNLENFYCRSTLVFANCPRKTPNTAGWI